MTPIKLTPNGGGRIRIRTDGPNGFTVISDTSQPPTSYRIEHAGRVTLCMLNGAMARVDGGDPGDEDRS